MENNVSAVSVQGACAHTGQATYVERAMTGGMVIASMSRPSPNSGLAKWRGMGPPSDVKAQMYCCVRCLHVYTLDSDWHFLRAAVREVTSSSLRSSRSTVARRIHYALAYTAHNDVG